MENLPNLITSLRLLGCILLASLFLHGWYGGTFAVYLVVALLDRADGKLAKALRLETLTGRFFDPFVDSLTHMTAFACLLSINVVPLWMFLVFLFREFGLLFIRLLASLQNQVLGGHWPGKIKALVYAIVLAVCFFNLWQGTDRLILTTWTWLFLAVVASVVSGVFYLRQYGAILSRAFRAGEDPAPRASCCR